MPAAAFLIRFGMPVDGGSIGKVRNFGEELMSQMGRQSLGTVSDPDTAIHELSVTITSPRHLGEVRRLIRSVLAKHHLNADAVVSRLR